MKKTWLWWWQSCPPVEKKECPCEAPNFECEQDPFQQERAQCDRTQALVATEIATLLQTSRAKLSAESTSLKQQADDLNRQQTSLDRATASCNEENKRNAFLNDRTVELPQEFMIVSKVAPEDVMQAAQQTDRGLLCTPGAPCASSIPDRLYVDRNPPFCLRAGGSTTLCDPDDDAMKFQWEKTRHDNSLCSGAQVLMNRSNNHSEESCNLACSEEPLCNAAEFSPQGGQCVLRSGGGTGASSSGTVCTVFSGAVLDKTGKRVEVDWKASEHVALWNQPKLLE